MLKIVVDDVEVVDAEEVEDVVVVVDVEEVVLVVDEVELIYCISAKYPR